MTCYVTYRWYYRWVSRALIIFMLMLLPFQFVWGAAAGYCAHEQGAAVKHFGHHVHKHPGKLLKASDQSSPDKKAFAGDDDSDCASCHLGCVNPVMQNSIEFALPAGKPLLAAPRSRHSLHIPYAIERPNWTLAA